MIGLTFAATMISAGLAQPQQPPGAFISCPGHPRCRPRPVSPPSVPVVPQPRLEIPLPIGDPPQIVYFDAGSATLSPQARTVLDRALPMLRSPNTGTIQLAGHDDRAARAAVSRRNSLRRAAAVRDYLLARGIPPGRIQLVAHGETRPAVETADGVREALNRRVEIVLRPRP